MDIIKQEIFTQTESLLLTHKLLEEKKEELYSFLHIPCRNFIFLGCGSGFMLSQGAAAMFSMYTDKKAVSLAGGEVLINPDKYQQLFDNSLVIVCSRSGETSEVILSLQEMKKVTNFRVLGVLAQEDCTLHSHVDYCLEIPWAYDNSVCQTRTISNIYYVLTMLLAYYTDNQEFTSAFSDFFIKQPAFLNSLENDCKTIAAKPWNNITVLADGEVRGIACEGSLAFTEICILPGECFNLLDYRHGPIVLANEKKLILILLTPNEEYYQKQVVCDLKKHGSFIVTLGAHDKEFWHSDFHINTDFISQFPVQGLAFINLCQVLAFYKALACGHDPDTPEGLNPFIKF